MSRPRLPVEFLLSIGVLACLWMASSWGGELLRSAGLLFVFIFNASLLGDRWASRLSQSKRWLMGILLALSWQTILQTAAYYLSIPLSGTTDLIISALLATATLVSGYWPRKAAITAVESEVIPAHEPIHLWWSVLCCIAASASLVFVGFIALKHGATASIRTPWPLLPAGFFGLIALPILASLLAAWRSRSLTITALCVSAAILSVTCLTPLLYPNGYGFDGFLHRASETVLLDSGVLHPKPPYYLGQYTLVTWLARLCHFSVHPFDVWLVPLLCLLPVLLFWILSHNTLKERFWLALFPLFLPLAGLMTTTPQALSYLLGVSAVLITLKCREQHLSPLFSLSLGAWAVATHPLGGLPFFGVVLALFWWQYPFTNKWLRWLGLALLWIGSVLLIPSLFFLQKNAVHWQASILTDTSALKATLAPFWHIPGTHLNPWVDLADSVRFLLPLLLLTGCLISLFRARWRQQSFPYVLMGSAFLLSGYLLERISDFSFLISYERLAYAERLYMVASFLCLFPLLFILSEGVSRLSKQSTALLLCLFLTATGWQSLHIYNSLPRHDAGAASYGWSVGTDDKTVVRWIDQQAQGKPYAVLANQTVSAAAIEAFGFKRYVNEVFYYPIPTGGPLYQLFLEATKKDSNKQPILDAAKLTQSQTVFVVINQYWWDADQVKENLTSLADEHQLFNNGNIEVFRFNIPTASP